MLHGAAWAARRDRAYALVEVPQQRHLPDWREQRTRRRAELAEKTARRQAEFTALLPAIAAQVAADVSAAVAAALQATRAEPLKELDLAPTTTTTSIISESSTSIQMPGGSSSISTTGEAASASHDLDLPSAVPVTCSTDCPRRDNGSSDATASVAASVVLDVALDISAPTRCLTMEPSLGNESLARVLASAKSDMALAEHYDKSEEDEDNSVPLFQWDPGEKPMVLRDSVLSRDIAWPACVKKMNADLSGSRDYDQKSGYADTQTYAESDSVCSNIAVVLMPQVLDVIPVTTSADQDDPQDDQRLLSTEVIQLTYDNHFGLTLEKSAVQPLVICDMFRTLSRTLWSQILYVELLKNQFDCAGPINKQYLECLTACATTYPSMCATTHSNCLLSWDPGDKTKLSCSSDNAIAKYFCQHIYKELLQYLYKQYLESLVVFAPAYLPVGVVQVAYAVLLLEYFSVIQKNCQLQYGDVKWWSDFSTIDGNHRTKANVGCVITATHFEQDLESECRTLIRNCPSNSDGALVDRIPFPLLEFVVKLVRSHNFIGGTVHLQFPQPLQEAQVYLALPDQISMEEPFSCSQCVHLQMCRPPDRAKFSGKLLLGTLDEKSLRYSICCGSETIQWEIAWTLRYGCDFLIQTDGLRIARMPTFILALVEHLYEFSALSRCGEPWMSWQIQFLVPGTRIASPVYTPLICLKARDELKMMLELSMQTDTNASNICGILLHNMDTCSSLQNIECTWFLASCIQPGTRLFLGTESFMFPLSIEGYIDTNHALLWFTWSLAVVNYPSAVLIEFSKGISAKTIHYFSQLQDLLALIKLQSWPALEAYLSGHNLQYYTQFGSTTWADQTKYRTEDYIESIIVPSFWFGTIGYATIHGSSHFQWFIAWSHTLARAAVRTIHWAGPIISLITTEALASISGMHFLLQGAAVHYSPKLFQELSNSHLQYDFELLQWLIAWSLATRNGYAVVIVSYLSLQVLVVLSTNGYVGRTTPYGVEQSEWKIAWLLNIKTRTLSLGDMQEISLGVQCFNHKVRTTNWQSSSTCSTVVLPWFPGDSTRHRLEGKPDFKKGGLSATILIGKPSTGIGLELGRHYLASACSEATRAAATNTVRGGLGRVARNGTASASPLLVSLFLRSCSSPL